MAEVWNDRMRSAAEGYPCSRGMQVSAGDVAATVSIPTNAAVHTVHVEAHSGDATVAFPASSGGSTLSVKNGSVVSLDFKGHLAGGSFVVSGSGCHYLFSWVPAS